MDEIVQFAELLKLYRKRNGFTQEDLAKGLGYSKETITAWERGKRHPTNVEITRLAHLLEVDVEKLSRSIRLSRSKIYIPKNSVETLFDSIDDKAINEKLDDAESVINLAWEVWFAAKPKRATWEIYRILPNLDQMLHAFSTTHYLPRIRELIMRCHGLLGGICVDALNNDAALFHYIQAYKLATDGHDINQAATYFALIGDTLRRQGEKRKAISSMENAREQALKASQVTQGHVLQLLAYTYADTGHAIEFEQNIQKATDLLAFSNEAQDVAKKEFVPFEIYEIRGKANRDLGRPLEALRYLELAEKSLRREMVTPRWYAVLDISKGQAYCDADDITTGVELAMQGFTLAYQCRSLRQMNRVRKLLQKLKEGPYKGEKKVAELQELLYETYIHMDLER